MVCLLLIFVLVLVVVVVVVGCVAAAAVLKIQEDALFSGNHFWFEMFQQMICDIQICF